MNGSSFGVRVNFHDKQQAILRLTGTFNFLVGGKGIVFRGTNLGVSAPGTTNSATIILTQTNSVQQSGLVNMTFLFGGAAMLTLLGLGALASRRRRR